MSDYEIAYLALVAQDNLTNVFMSFATLVFAFVAAGFFGANIINRASAVLLTFVYSIVAIVVGISAQGTAADFFSLMLEIHERANAGHEALQWHTIKDAPRIVLKATPIIVGWIAVFSYLGSVYFFLLQWRRAQAEK